VKKNIGEGNKRAWGRKRRKKREKRKNEKRQQKNYRECDKGKGQNRE